MGTIAWTRWMIGALALVLAMAIARPAAATTLSLSTCVLPAKTGMTPRALFANPARFDCVTPQTAFGRGDFWVLSQPLRPAALHGATVRFASSWMNRVTLFVLHADGSVRRTGVTRKTAGRFLRLGAVIGLPLPRADAPPIRLLWHVEGAGNLRGILLGPKLVDHGASADTEIISAALYGAFAGMAIALVVYNLALWAALRQTFQPVYCVLVLCLLAYAATSSGAVGQVFPGLDNNDRQRMNIVFLAFSGAAALLFARSFFERRVFAGWLGPLSTAVTAALIGSSLLWATFAPWHIHLLDTILSSAYAALIALVPLVLWRAWAVRSNFLWLFAVAWGAPIVMGVLRLANAFDLIGWSVALDNSTILSMAMEALLSSVAIAYRIRLLSRERDQAREQEIAARLLADTDPLTGLLNRRAFLAGAIGRAGDQMLLVVDIDHFKHVNETIGHDGGDEVLRVIARALRDDVPADALVARIGGEEFAIVADAATAPCPSAILARLRAERMPYDIAVTASIGSCAGVLLRETDWKTLYRRADQALFAAKAAGRDRARSADTLAVAA